MSAVPEPVLREVEAALADRSAPGSYTAVDEETGAAVAGGSVAGVSGPRTGPAETIRSARPLGGGCISPCARVETSTGDPFFLKWGHGGTPADFFFEEARSLEALRGAGALRVPAVEAVAEGWLLLEWLEPGAARVEGWTALGSNLAAQHRQTGDTFGWESANYIGSLPQPNDPAATWPAFWRDCRLLPQLRRADAAHALDGDTRARFDRLLDELDMLLGPGGRDGASLLHGDLWSGNVHFLADGGAAAIDPSTYRGHREVDLAMAELFGGFPRAFFDAYREEWPLQPGYDRRRPVYQLYYLLVHVNLFGSAYMSGLLGALAAAESGAR